MRIATWNIRAGGGKRTERIAQVILDESPDVLVITEFRPTPGRALLELLKPMSYHVATASRYPGTLAQHAPVLKQPDLCLEKASQPSEPRTGRAAPRNCVCVLSRMPIESLTVESVPQSLHRWSLLTVPYYDLTILGAHVPNQSEIWNKVDFWECVESLAMSSLHKRTVILGDLNTALDEDCEGDPIREAVFMKRLLAAGWVDAWRQHNPDKREYSWYSHRSNGFRIDHCLVSPCLAPLIRTSAMRHDVRAQGLSDHSFLSVTLDA